MLSVDHKLANLKYGHVFQLLLACRSDGIYYPLKLIVIYIHTHTHTHT